MIDRPDKSAITKPSGYEGDEESELPTKRIGRIAIVILEFVDMAASTNFPIFAAQDNPACAVIHCKNRTQLNWGC